MSGDIDKSQYRTKTTRGTGMAPCPTCGSLSVHVVGPVYECNNDGEWERQ